MDFYLKFINNKRRRFRLPCCEPVMIKGFFSFQICLVTMPSHAHRHLFPSLMSKEEYQGKWDLLRAVVDQLLQDPPGSHIVSFEEMHRNES